MDREETNHQHKISNSKSTSFQAKNNHDIWREANKTLSENERLGQELTVLVQTIKDQLDAKNTEIQSIKSMKQHIDSKIQDIQAAITVAAKDQTVLCAKNQRAMEEIVILRRQRDLLSSTIDSVKRRVVSETVKYEAELAQQRTRLRQCFPQVQPSQG